MTRFVLASLLALCAAATAPAQDWAKAKLEKSPRHGEWVTLKHDGRDVQAFVVYPEVKGKATAVVVIHEIFGLTDWVRSVADDLAANGYIAIAPDLLSGTGPKGGGTDSFGGESVRKAIMGLPPEQITKDLTAATEYVSKLPSGNGKVAVGGFCWGGGQAFRFADNKEMKAAFAFYGTGPSTESSAKAVSAPVYGFYGGNDNRVNATIPKTTEAMKAAGKKYEPVIYEGAGHGFMRAGEAPDATAANKKARDEAWARMKKVLAGL